MFDLERLGLSVGRKIRDIYAELWEPDLILADDDYIEDLAQAMAGNLGGKVGIAPRLYLKKLVGDVLDRIDQFPDFDPRAHYALTVADSELTEARAAAEQLQVQMTSSSSCERL